MIALPEPYYRDDSVVLYHADCLDLLPLIGEVDHCLTDPPYQSVTRADSLPGKYGKLRDGSERVRDLGYDPPTDAEIAAYAAAVAKKPRRWCLVFCGAEEVGKWIVGLAAELRHVRVGAWARSNPAPQFSGDRPSTGFEACEIAHRRGAKMRWNGGGHAALWTYPQTNSGALARQSIGHATPKPLPLIRELVRLFTDPGELILDPFAGSGTLGLAARLEGRRAILIEREERYCDVARRRLADLPLDDPRTGQVALAWEGT